MSDMSEAEKKTVRELREEHGLTREQLAVALKTTFSTIVRIELGKTKPRLDLAERIYAFFKVPVGSIDWSVTGGRSKRMPVAA